jgi:hypothetical protein
VDPDRDQKQRYPAGNHDDGTSFHFRHGTTPLRCLHENSESMHHHLKMTLPNERARSVGRHRQLFDLDGYQAHLAITTLLAWHHRTGADLSRWFGQWKPPNHAIAAAA